MKSNNQIEKLREENQRLSEENTILKQQLAGSDMALALSRSLEELRAFTRGKEGDGATQLETCRQLMHFIVNSVPRVTMFILDKDFRYLLFNENHKVQMKRVFGVDIAPGFAINSVANNTIQPWSDITLNVSNAFNGEMATRTYKFETDLATGYYEISFIPFGIPDVNAVMVFSVNITEKQQALEELHKLSTVVEQGKISVMITDQSGIIEYMNPEAVVTTGYPADELIGKPMSELKSGMHSDDFYKRLWDTISKGEIWKGELLNRRKNGEPYWESEIISPVKNADGKIISFIAIKEDITQRKVSEERLRKSQAELKQLNASKDKFFSIIAHDLRGPFTGLLGFSEFLIDEIDELTPEQIQSFSQSINRSARHVFNLIDNLLQWSRIQTGRIEFAPAEIILDEIVRPVIDLSKISATKKDIQINQVIDHEVTVFADRNMVETVLRNLVSNAVKFTYAGGKVTVTTDVEDNYVSVSVTDTGVGIKEENIDKLFRIDANVSTVGTDEEEGTGLGLILCKEFVEMNGGTITVESETEKGSTFSFTIPRRKFEE